MGKKRVIIQKSIVENLNIDIKSYNNVNKPKLKLDVAVYYLSLFNSIPAYYREENQSDIVSLDSQRLRQINSNSTKYFKFFIDYGYILVNKEYGADTHTCREYILTETYINDLEIISYSITDKILIKKFDNKGRTKIDLSKSNYCKEWRPHLVKCFDEHLTIKADDAYDEVIKKYKSKDTRRKLITNLHLINEFENQSWRYSYKPESDNRVHSNLTRSSKLIRKHIRYKGRKLAAIDIKASQPFFLSVLIKAIVTKDRGILNDIAASHILSDEIIDELFNLNLVNNREELLEFVLPVLKNDFYTVLEENFDIPLNEDGKPFRVKSNYGKNKPKKYVKDFEPYRTIVYDSKREYLKELVMEIFYSKPNTPLKEAKIFKQLFPSVYKIFVCLHKYNIKFPYLLQYIEANVLLDYTADMIEYYNPDMPLFSIHDSLVTYDTPTFIDIVKEEMVKHIKELTTLKPQVNIERWAN